MRGMSDGSSNRGAIKGLRLFLDEEQQRGWLEGDALRDGDRADFHETLEQRFKYAGRFEKLLQLPQAEDIIDILRSYAPTCIPIPRATERFYWSVSCLPGSPDKPLVRANASWMELFTVHADGDDLCARFILHRSDFTTLTLSPAGRGQGEGAQRSLSGAVPPHPNPLPAGEREPIGDPDQLDEDLLASCVDDPDDITH